MHRTILVACLALSTASAATADSTRVTTRDGVRLHVARSGPADGEPVLLLHGLAASALTNWELPGIARALAGAGFRVIAPDHRGHGCSGSPADGAYGARLVDDALDVLDALDVRRAHVVGYSMGGLVGLRLAAERPDRVRSLFLGGMGWLGPDARERALARAIDRGARGHSPRSADRAPGRGSREATRAVGSRGWERARGVAACASQLAELALEADALARVDVPVSVVVGGLDPLRVLVDRLHEARPGWPVQVVPFVGHLGCVATRELRESIVAHVRRCAGR